MDEANRLLNLKQQIDDADDRVSVLTGRKMARMDELKKNWNCNSLVAAEEVIQKIENDINEFDDKIDAALEEINKKYEL